MNQLSCSVLQNLVIAAERKPSSPNQNALSFIIRLSLYLCQFEPLYCYQVFPSNEVILLTASSRLHSPGSFTEEHTAYARNTEGSHRALHRWDGSITRKLQIWKSLIFASPFLYILAIFKNKCKDSKVGIPPTCHQQDSELSYKKTPVSLARVMPVTQCAQGGMREGKIQNVFQSTPLLASSTSIQTSYHTF